MKITPTVFCHRPAVERFRTVLAAAFVVGATVLSMAACENQATAHAERITSPASLIGGPSALGAVGDYLLENDQLRVILQNKGWSRGFGVFGGGIIDADVVRQEEVGAKGELRGRDNFGEFFPALFMQAFDVQDVTRDDPATGATQQTFPAMEIIADGSDGGPAIIRTRARGGDFISMVKVLLDFAVPSSGLSFETDYILHPGARHVEIVGRLRNDGSKPVTFPKEGIDLLLGQFGVDALQTPLGDITLFGAGNHIFVPGAVQRTATELAASPVATTKPIGYDLRYALDSVYAQNRSLPAMAGIVADFIATSGPGVSYGVAVADSDRNYVWLNRDAYRRDPAATVSKHSMLIPFYFSSFVGSFYEVPPDAIQPGDSYSYTKYFMVGHGDVGSIRDELYRIRGSSTGVFAGEVVDAVSGLGEANTDIVILDAQGRPYSQTRTDAAGRFRTPLAPGEYAWIARAHGRHPFPGNIQSGQARPFTIAANKQHHAYIRLPQAAQLTVQVRDNDGRRLPAKVTVVSHYDQAFDKLAPREHLFDLALGEERRPTDLTWKDPVGQRERAYAEATLHTHNGVALAHVPANANCDTVGCGYDVYVSRGPEYEVQVVRDVRLQPGQRQTLTVTLAKVVDTQGYVSADMHIHAMGSLDSFVSLEDRVRSAAAEGLEIAVSTDHNFVTDYRPAIERLGLQDWVKGVVGVEVSTLEMGHFNGFPLRHDVSVPSRFPFVQPCFDKDSEHTNRKSFEWVLCRPDQIFDNLRALGSLGPEQTIVQVNHPRDAILGYFNQYYVDSFTGEATGPDPRRSTMEAFIYPHRNDTKQFDKDNFSYNYDAIEVFNGKRLDMVHNFKLPTTAPPPLVAHAQDAACGSGHPNNKPGAVLLGKTGQVAYPGVVDDWFNLLNAGHKMTATGNSDTHGLDAEVGTPRTYVYVGDEDTGTLSSVKDATFVAGIKQHRAVVTNGPMLLMQAQAARLPEGATGRSVVVDDTPLDDLIVHDGAGEGAPTGTAAPTGAVANIGETLHLDPADSNGAVTVTFDLQTAPWVQVDEVVLYANGVPVKAMTIANAPEEDLQGAASRHTLTTTLQLGRDTVLVAEARGSRSLFPMVTPEEVPPATMAAALGGLLGGLMGTTPPGMAPSFVQKATPYAITNPIWVDTNGNGEFDPPGQLRPTPEPAPRQACETAGASAATPQSAAPAPLPPAHGQRVDVRNWFRALSH